MKNYIILLFALSFIVIATITLNYEHQYTRRIQESKKCRIDSISSRLKYEVLPEKIYTYHTICGNIMTSKQSYSIGDSIEINVISLENK